MRMHMHSCTCVYMYIHAYSGRPLNRRSGSVEKLGEDGDGDEDEDEGREGRERMGVGSREQNIQSPNENRIDESFLDPPGTRFSISRCRASHLTRPIPRYPFALREWFSIHRDLLGRKEKRREEKKRKEKKPSVHCTIIFFYVNDILLSRRVVYFTLPKYSSITCLTLILYIVEDTYPQE